MLISSSNYCRLLVYLYFNILQDLASLTLYLVVQWVLQVLFLLELQQVHSHPAVQQVQWVQPVQFHRVRLVVQIHQLVLLVRSHPVDPSVPGVRLVLVRLKEHDCKISVSYRLSGATDFVITPYTSVITCCLMVNITYFLY